MKNTLHLPIVIEKDEDGVFIVSCSSFTGCHSYGYTIEEAMMNIREAIELCMEDKEELEYMNEFVEFRELEIAI